MSKSKPKEKEWKAPTFNAATGCRAFGRQYSAGSVYFDEDLVSSKPEEVKKCEAMAKSTFEVLLSGQKEQIDTRLVHQNMRYLHDFLNSKASNEVREQFCQFLAENQLLKAWLAFYTLKSTPGFDMNSEMSKLPQIYGYVVAIMELVMNFHHSKLFLEQNCLEKLIADLKENSPKDNQNFHHSMNQQVATNYLVILQLIVQEYVQQSGLDEKILKTGINGILVPFIKFRRFEISMPAMIIKSYFARKEEDQSGGALTPSQSLLKDLVAALSDSQKTDNTSRRSYFSADLFLWKNYICAFELLTCVYNMVKASERNAVMLVRAGLVPQLTRVLTIWNESDTTLFDRKRFTNEKLNALQTCHLLALIAPTAKELRANEELILSLQRYALLAGDPELNKNGFEKEFSVRESSACLQELGLEVEKKSQLPMASESSNPQTGGPYAMISYCHKNQENAFKLRDALKAAGIPYWIDVEKMKGSIEEAMDVAVRGAAVVLVCFSQSYKDSQQCQSEALIARQLKKIIVPVRVQSGYEYDGWLRTVLIGLLYYDITQSQGALDELVKQLKKSLEKLGPLDVMTAETAQPADSGSHAQAQEQLAALKVEQVQQLLEKNGLSNLKECFKKNEIDGTLLAEMQKIQQAAPEFFFQQFGKLFNQDFLQCLNFSKFLRKWK